MRDFFFPAIVVVVNLWLAAAYGMPVFYVVAAVIFVLAVLKWRATRGGNREP